MTLAAVTSEQQDQKTSTRRKEPICTARLGGNIPIVQKLEYGWNMEPQVEIRTKGLIPVKTCTCSN
jgi:hypothetical protein